MESQGIVINIERFQQEIIANARVDGKSFDGLEGKIDSAARVRLTIAGNDLQALFEQIIKSHLGSFKNIKRSLPAVKTAIYLWFEKYLGAKSWPEVMTLIQKVFLHNGNRKSFEEILIKAIEKYKSVKEEEVQKRAIENEQWYEFEIVQESFFNQYTDERAEVDNYIYEPCYLSVGRSNPEKSFEEFLNNNSDRIVWWWKNGEDKKDYFGIKYEYPENLVHTFYPDYLVQLVDGGLGIFEVKDVGDRDGGSSTKAKAKALQTYIKEQNLKGKELSGGIVIKKNGSWKINQKEKYDWGKCERNDWSDWDKLTI